MRADSTVWPAWGLLGRAAGGTGIEGASASAAVAGTILMCGPDAVRSRSERALERDCTALPVARARRALRTQGMNCATPSSWGFGRMPGPRRARCRLNLLHRAAG